MAARVAPEIARRRSGRIRGLADRPDQTSLRELAQELDDILFGAIRRNIERPAHLRRDRVYRGRPIREPPDVRANLVQREDGIQVADAADNGHDDRFVGDLTGHEFATAVSRSGDLTGVHG